MNIIIKTVDDIQNIKQAIKIWQATKALLLSNCQPGVTLRQLNDIASDKIKSLSGFPTFYGKYGFPGDICISVNDCIIHGVPNDYALQRGDLVKFDMGVTYQNRICDAAFACVVGGADANPAAQKMIDSCYRALENARQIIKPGITNMEIAKIIEQSITNDGYYILHDFTGHGCGVQLHEDPLFPNYYDLRFPVVKLKENMVFCLEPMILTDSNEFYLDQINQWNVYAKNKLLTCHVEDMFLVTKDGCVVLTQEK